MSHVRARAAVGAALALILVPLAAGPAAAHGERHEGAHEFPAKDPTAAALSDSITRLQPRVDQARTAVNAASSKAKSAKDSAGAATTLSIVALVVAVVLGLLAILLSRRGRRRTV